MEQIEQPIKKKRGRPPKTTPTDEKQKSETKQFPLTFKCNSELEMDLYNHLTNKLYRGAYIKEILIREMAKERPDLAIKYGLPTYTQPVPVPVQPQVIQEPQPTPVIVEVEEDVPVVQEMKADPVDVEDDKPKIKRGLGTLDLF